MDLDAEAVVLGLHTHRPELLDHGLRVGQALRELWPERLAGPDLERVQAGLTSLPERPRDEPEVGCAVVGSLQQWTQ